MKLNFMPRSKRFLGPPVDEVALHAEAERALAACALGACGKAAEADLARTLAAAHPDLATCILYKHLLQSHGPFIRGLDGLPAAPDPAPKDVRILIVPGMFHAEYPDVGADGKLVRSIFAKNGFAAEIVPVDSRGTVGVNQGIVREALLRRTDGAVWLISISKGSADVRACLQDLPAGDIPRHLKGWINFSGTFSGSILSDHRSDTAFKKIYFRLVCLMAGVDYALVEEMATTNPIWLRKPGFAERMEIIHVLGFPLLSHVQPMLAHRFLRLSKWGPTDGMIRLLDAVGYPGHVYPVWGCDHFARTSALSALLYRLSRYISSTHAPLSRSTGK
jgi:hypothetical protein